MEMTGMPYCQEPQSPATLQRGRCGAAPTLPSLHGQVRGCQVTTCTRVRSRGLKRCSNRLPIKGVGGGTAIQRCANDPCPMLGNRDCISLTLI
jgi:hypothetical protein